MKTILKLLTITINFLATLATPYHFTARRAPSPRNAKARRRLVFVLPMGDEPPGDDLPESLSNMVARWHGGVEDKFANIENLVTTLEANRSLWPVPNDIITWLDTNMTALNELMQKCRSRNATSNDRLKRNTLVNKMVYYSLDTVRNWVYGEYAIKVMTREDIHMLGFLLMGENSKSRRRGGEVFVLAEIKARVNDDRTVNLVIDQASDKNAALVEEGWPKGAHQALLVIKDTAGNEVIRKMTTHLHNHIIMPDDSRGKQFVARASFMAHVDDEPHFGNQATFTIPLLIDDIRPDNKK